jgi:long-chain acyl-CoA synthetase
VRPQWDHKHNVIDLPTVTTLAGLFARRAELTPGERAYIYWSPGAGNGWHTTTWQKIYAEMLRWRAALSGEALKLGDRVAILLPNGPEWICIEQAALALGLVPVPLYNWDSNDNISGIIADCGARVLVLESATRLYQLASHIGSAPELRRIVAISGRPDDGDHRLVSLSDWLHNAQDNHDGPPPTDPNALATIIYTSGATGRPKGVMLSHRNILDNAAGILEIVPPRPDDLFLSVLPLAHAYERTVGYYVPMIAGLPVAYARSPQMIVDDMIVHRPTIMLVVPRVLERIHTRIYEARTQKSFFIRKVFALMLAVGWRRFCAAQARRQAPFWTNLTWLVLSPLTVTPILAQLGGSLRLVVCGGAPLAVDVCRLFLSLGISVLQGYGMTETSPVVSSNRIDDNLPESAGRPMRGWEVNLGNESELLVRSSCVMLGYWRQLQKTREVIDHNGWLHTGDIAEIRDGRIHVTGRLSDVVKLSTGHKVPLSVVEKAIVSDPLFNQAVAIAENRPVVTAIVVVEHNLWRELAKTLHVDPDDHSTLSNKRIEATVINRMAARLHQFPTYYRPQRVILEVEPWSIDGGLLTPTLKPKRKNIMAHYAPQLEAIQHT